MVCIGLHCDLVHFHKDIQGHKTQLPHENFLVDEADDSMTQEKVVALQMQSLEKEDASFAMSQMLPPYSPWSSPECSGTLQQFLGG